MMEEEMESCSLLVGPMDRYIDTPESSKTQALSIPAATKLLSRGNTTAKRKKIKQRLAMMTQESSELAEKRLQARDVSIRKIQKCWLEYCSRREFIVLHKLLLHYQLLSLHTRKKYIRRKSYAQHIQHWWRSLLQAKRDRLCLRFTQNGKWTSRQANIVFALLIGYRLRRKMKTCPSIITSRESLQDAWKVLEGIAQEACSVGQGMANAMEVSVHDIIHVSVKCDGAVISPASFNVDGARLFRLWNCGVSVRIDWPFARMFAKQVLASRQKIWNNTIGSSWFCLFPGPGYWHIRYWPEEEGAGKVSVRAVVASSQSFSSNGRREASGHHLPRSPMKPMPPASGGDENHTQPVMHQSPVSLGALLNKKRQQNRKQQPQSHLEDIPLNASPLADVNCTKATSSSFTPPPVDKPIRSSLLGGVGAVDTSISPHHSSAVPAQPTATPLQAAPRRKQSNGAKPHLQICVVMAERLPPTRKRSSHGRRPGFRLTLLLPSKTAAASAMAEGAENMGPLKQVQSYLHDAQEVTLEPVWNDTAYFTLPVPMPVAGPPTLPCPALNGDALLREYWSRGVVKVEVLDGDRFNEDTHLGETSLLLSGFLDLPRGPLTSTPPHVKTISGVFPLTRKSSSDRPGGVIHVTAFLHMPESTQLGGSADDSQLMLQQERQEHHSRQERSQVTKRPSTAAPRAGLCTAGGPSAATGGGSDGKGNAVPAPKDNSMLITPPRFRGEVSSRRAALDNMTTDVDNEVSGYAPHSSVYTPYIDADKTPPVNPLAAGTPSGHRHAAPAAPASRARSSSHMKSPISGPGTGDGVAVSERRRRRTPTAIDAFRAGQDLDIDNNAFSSSVCAGGAKPTGRSGSSCGKVLSGGRPTTRVTGDFSPPASNPFQSILDEKVDGGEAHIVRQGDDAGAGESRLSRGGSNQIGVLSGSNGIRASRDVSVDKSSGFSMARRSTNDTLRQSRISMQFQQLDMLASSLQTDADSAVENLSRKLKQRASKSDDDVDSAATTAGGVLRETVASPVSEVNKEGSLADKWIARSDHIISEIVPQHPTAKAAGEEAVPSTSVATSRSRKLVLGVPHQKDEIMTEYRRPEDISLTDAENLLAKFDQRLCRTSMNK